MKIEGSLPKVHWVIRLHPSLLHLILCWLLPYLLPSFTVSSAASLPASVLHPCAVTMMDRWRVLLSSQICSCRKPRLTAVTVIPGTSVLPLLVSFPSLLCPYLIYSHLCQNYTHAHKHPSAPHTQTRTRASSATVTTRNGRLKPRQPSSILTLLTPPPAAGVGGGGIYFSVTLFFYLCVCVCAFVCVLISYMMLIMTSTGEMSRDALSPWHHMMSQTVCRKEFVRWGCVLRFDGICAEEKWKGCINKP